MPNSAADGVPMATSWPSTKPTMNTSLVSGLVSTEKVKATLAEDCPAAKSTVLVCETKSCPTEREREAERQRWENVNIT